MVGVSCLVPFMATSPYEKDDTKFISSTNNPEVIETVDNINKTSDWGKVKQNGKIYVNNREVDLEIIFKDRENSLKLFKKQFTDQLELIRKNSNFKELSVDNYKDYYLLESMKQCFLEKIIGICRHFSISMKTMTRINKL